MSSICTTEDEDYRVNPERSIRILIADDHPVVRKLLRSIFNRQPNMEVVTEAGNSLEAIQQFFLHLPDITLLDLRMPDLDGAATVAKIRSRAPSAKIVIMSAYEGEEEVCIAILAGADGFLPKVSPQEQLVDCIREVYAGRKWIPAEIASKLADRVATSNLSGRESEIVNLLAAGKSNKEIGAALHVTEETIEVRVSDILSKLRETGPAEAIAKAIKGGFLRLPGPSKHRHA